MGRPGGRCIPYGVERAGSARPTGPSRVEAEGTGESEDKLAEKPANLSFEEAAALPTSGLAALHGLRDAGRLRPGQAVLVNGASGGVGSFAVQIAKALGAEVTGVTSTDNIELVRSLGADRVIDYRREDFTKGGPLYDLIFDNVENRSLADVRQALKPEGTLVLNSGTGDKGFATLVRLARPLVLSPLTSQNLRRYLSRPNTADLNVLKALVEQGKVRPHIDRTYELADTAAALAYITGGHSRGKVIVNVSQGDASEERRAA